MEIGNTFLEIEVGVGLDLVVGRYCGYICSRRLLLAANFEVPCKWSDLSARWHFNTHCHPDKENINLKLRVRAKRSAETKYQWKINHEEVLQVAGTRALCPICILPTSITDAGTSHFMPIKCSGRFWNGETSE